MANATQFGVMTAADFQPGYLSQVGVSVVWDTANATLAQWSAQVRQSFAIFVEGDTTDYKTRYVSASGGIMQEVDQLNDQSRTGEVKGGTAWDVAYPMRGFREPIGGSERVIKQLSRQEFDNRVQTMKNRYLDTYRFQVMASLLRNTSYTYTDPKYGDLTVQPLASGDAVKYAVRDGSSTVAVTRNNFFGAAADWSTLSDAKNPFPAIVTRLRLLYGRETRQNPIVIFINSAQEASAGTLAGFVEVPEIYVVPGSATATLQGLPGGIPGRLIGTCDGALISVWDQVPPAYVFGIHTAGPGPLTRRVDPPNLGTSPDLVLTNPAGDYNHPLVHWYFESWFGLGVGNRANGVAYDLTGTTANTYTVPTSFQ